MNLIVSLVTILLIFWAESATSQGIYTEHGCRADLCFIIDKSGSVGRSNWDLTVEFMLDFVEKLSISPQATKVGVVTFDDWGYFEQPLSGNKTQLQDAISNLVYDGFGTAIDEGLYTARTECFQTANGDRDDANNIAVLITDGDSSFYYADQEALNLRATGATIIAVGVGTGVNLDLLEAVANGLDNVFLVADFTALLTDTSLILGRSCSFSEACLANLDSSDDYPSLTDCPRLSNPLVDGYEFYFTCFINHTSESGAKYKVTFLADGETSLYQETLTLTEDTVRLNQSYLQGHMGKYVSCRVETYWESSPGIVSAAVSSRSYWIGITFSKRVVAVYETDDNPRTECDNAALMHTFSTVPVLCPLVDNRTCHLGLSIRTTGSIAVFQQKENEIQKCFAMIFRHEWKPEDSLGYNADRPIQVMAKRLWVPSLIRKGSISMTTVPHQYSHPDGGMYSPWDNYQPADIPVLVHGGNKRCLCTSTGDPHITTCDGLSYDAMSQGIYFLYHHRDVSVQVKHCLCSKPNCAYNCGVAVRQKYVGELIIDRSTGVVRLLQCEPKKEWSITPNDARDVFTVDTKYGVRVTVTLWPAHAYGMNVHVDIPSSTFSERAKPMGLGLCGNFNGNISDEFYLPGENEEKNETVFKNRWKVKDLRESYFACPNSTAEEEIEFCQCEGMEDQEKYGESPGIICGLNSPLLTNSWTNNQVRLLLPGFLKNNDLQGSRKRRSTDDNYEDDYAHINRKILSTDDNIANDIDEYDFDYQVPDSSFYEPAVGDDTPPAWGTFGISEAEAENTCRGVLSNSDAVTVCHSYVTDSLMDIIVDKCKDDIRRTGNESFASPYISEYQAYCIHNFLNEANVTDPDNPMDDPVFSQIYNNMMSKMCANNCSAHGICELGSCVCESGYVGADCSLPVGTQPTVTQYKGPPECDIRDRPCRMVQVQAENMTNSNNLSCQIHVQMANGSGETYTYRGELYTADVIFCPLPDPTTILTRSNSHLFTYAVSLSNDGEIFSDTPSAQQLSVFDSDQVWAACSQNGIYESKSGTCFIEGQCYRTGEKKGSCQVCDPTIDGQDWTMEIGCVPGSEDLSTTAEGPDIALESTVTQSDESTADVNTQTSSTDSLPASSSMTPASSTDSLPVSGSETTTSSADSLPASSSMTPASSTDSLSPSSSETTTSSTFNIPAASSITPTPASQQTTKLTSSTQQGISTPVTTTPDSELCYGSWTELSVCSKLCDYGIKSRTRDCLCDACTWELQENELCNEINCEELDTNAAGLGISFGGVTMIKYVAKEKEILTVALDLLNEYSKTHVADLCHSVDLDVLAGEVFIEIIFDSNNIQVAQGYPRLDPENEGVILTKMIVDVTLVELSGVCQLSSGKRKRRAMNSERIPVDSRYLTQALADLDTELTKMMGDGAVITIEYQEVSQPTTKTTNTKLIKIVVPVVIIALVVIVVAALVSTKMLKKRSITAANPEMKNKEEVENPSQRSDDISQAHDNPQMDVSVHLQPDDPDADAKQGIEQIPDDPTVRGPTPLERELTQSEIEVKGAWEALE